MLSAVLAEGLRYEGMLRMREGVQLVCSEASLSHVWWVSFYRMPLTTWPDKDCQHYVYLSHGLTFKLRIACRIHCDKCSNNFLPPSAVPHMRATTPQRCCNRCASPCDAQQQVQDF